MMETAVAGHPTLVITGDDGSRRVLALSGRDLRIGRSAENDVVLPDAAKGVSRVHAELRVHGNHYAIVDLQSQNGTWVDGERVQEATIAPGAEIAIGTYRLRVEVPAPVTLAVDDILLRDPSRQIPRATVRQPLEAPPQGRGTPVALYAALIAGVAVAGIAWLFWPSRSASPVTPVPVASAPPRSNSVGDGAASNAPAAAAVPSVPADMTPPIQNAPEPVVPGAGAAAPAAEIPVGDGAREGISGQTLETPAASRVTPGRKSAQDAFEAGTRLYAADDWVGAMRKFDEAREADASLPGLDRAARAVREKMRVAGRAAFNRAREYDAIGQSSEALKEYDRAVQWLPIDDANRAAAVSRAAKLRNR